MLRQRRRITSTFLFLACGLLIPNGLVSASDAAESPLKAVSPNGVVSAEFSLTDQGEPRYSVLYRGKRVTAPSALGLTFKNGVQLDRGLKLVDSASSSHRSTWKPVAGERSEIKNEYNSLIVHLELSPSETEYEKSALRQLDIEFRAFDSGIAFCYTVPKQEGLDSFEIVDESTRFRFLADHMCWSSQKVEGEYDHVSLVELEGTRGRPMVVEVQDGPQLAIGEARLVDFARMELARDPDHELTIRPVLGSDVVANAPFTTPWRYLMMADSASSLIENNDLVLNLNDPCAIEDPSWIRPGKVFRSTLSTRGSKATIDVAAKLNMQYILLDAGWYGSEFSDESDATTVTVDPKRDDGPLDLQKVVDYGRERNVGVILYVNRRQLETQLDTLLPLFKEWGIAGIKFGFVRVGDQKWTKWVHEAVKKCADHQIIVNIHDHYLPTGWSRTYPNLLTQEGIGGNEQMPSAKHNVTLPFIRFLCGPGDYTVCYYNGRIQTTRAHQLAASIVYFSPLQHLFWYDRPDKYRGEPELEVFKQLSTTWDDTKVIHGEMGSYITIARRADAEGANDRWLVGSMNAGERRQLEIPLDFLDPGITYEALICSDQAPDGSASTKVNVTRTEVTSESVLTADMASNGGQAIVLTPRNL
ncbi:glycoside hydrolase family 97 protein [Aporhodopirellula aestuarii]|uniref:Glycoside hydrolase family 97 protein n=1 Tax=Aporhodopirellula aestuarii TaxID=2950107 RepID=A0ABT0UFB3_9BACT|nr:glycoside hydrolase family 97 protein [Aporhodopirellula aestuarii]MCM2375279.1 glycoside hydrolase family 97 protein [Aporhodopirellula aestuarii]